MIPTVYIIAACVAAYAAFGLGIAIGVAAEMTTRRTGNLVTGFLFFLSLIAWPVVLIGLAGLCTVAIFLAIFRRIMDGAQGVEIPAPNLMPSGGMPMPPQGAPAPSDAPQNLPPQVASL